MCLMLQSKSVRLLNTDVGSDNHYQPQGGACSSLRITYDLPTTDIGFLEEMVACIYISIGHSYI